jgi:Homeodomain-like domain
MLPRRPDLKTKKIQFVGVTCPRDFGPGIYVRDRLPIRREQSAKRVEEQMMAVIREADREPVSVVAKRHGISEQTIYTWRKRFGGHEGSRRKNR